ncbi:putative arsenate reductase ArsC [Streptomyces xantholiticus]|nr:putative arsenate reductase ArsC [Streptomyces xantholiticus]
MTASSHPVLLAERLPAGAARLAVRRRRYAVEKVQRLSADSYGQPAANPHVRTYLVVLEERFAAERLDAPVQVESPADGGRPVLFACSHNAGRSQMAAALPAHRAGADVIVSSAGTHPAGAVEPHVVQLLAEAGVALDEVYPEPLTDEVVQAADIVITWGAATPAPWRPAVATWTGPSRTSTSRRPRSSRSIRDAIDARITDLLDTLPPGN